MLVLDILVKYSYKAWMLTDILLYNPFNGLLDPCVIELHKHMIAILIWHVIG